MKIWEKSWDLEATIGEKTQWTLGAPSEFVITKLVLVQTGGTTVSKGDIYLKIFNSERIFTGGSLSSGGAENEENNQLDPDIYLVCEQLVNNTSSDSDGKLVRFFGSDSSCVYTNTDNGPTNRNRKIYLQLDLPVGGSELSSWNLAISGMIDVG